MTGKKIKVSFNNYINKTRGNRDYPFVFFYIFPMFTYSRVEPSSFNIHLGWLHFSILIEFHDDYR